MQVVLLLEDRLGVVPPAIKTIQDWGPVTIRIKGEHVAGGERVTGNHVMLEGDQGEFEKWLAPFDVFWVGVGSPIIQQFEACHIGANVSS